MAPKRHLLRHMTLAAGLAVGLAACSQPVTYKWNYYDWSPSKLSYAAGQGGILTDIRGNPFAASKEDVDRIITQSMFRAHFGPAVPFVTEQQPDSKSPYRVVMVFNPEETLDTYTLCSGDPQPGPANAVEIKIAAALCGADRIETSVWGRVPAGSGPQDPKFQSLIRQMTHLLFPNIDPTIRDNNKEWISMLR